MDANPTACGRYGVPGQQKASALASGVPLQLAQFVRTHCAESGRGATFRPRTQCQSDLGTSVAVISCTGVAGAASAPVLDPSGDPDVSAQRTIHLTTELFLNVISHGEAGSQLTGGIRRHGSERRAKARWKTLDQPRTILPIVADFYLFGHSFQG